MATTFDIPESNLATLQKRVARYVNRAKKHGYADIEFSVLGVEERPIEIPDHFARLRGEYGAVRTVREKIAKVELNDVKTMIGDWTIIGNRQKFRNHGRNEFLSFGVVSPEIARKDMCCDHCETVRNRTLVYVLKNAESKQVQVGSTCLSDFVGSDVPSGLAQGLQIHSMIAREISEASSPYWRNGKPAEVVEESKLVMAIANRIIQDRGWLSSAAARSSEGTPTWQEVGRALELSRTEDGIGLDSLIPLASDFIAAEDAIAWIATKHEDFFWHSVQESIDRGACGVKDIALLSAGMASYRMHLGRQVEIDELKSRASEHVGTPGQRIELIVTVRKMKPFLSEFGGGLIISMISADGDLLTWITGKSKGLAVGKTFEIKGTVKKHQSAQGGMFKGMNETILSRVAVVSELANAPSPIKHVEAKVSEDVYESIDDHFSYGPSF